MWIFRSIVGLSGSETTSLRSTAFVLKGRSSESICSCSGSPEERFDTDESDVPFSRISSFLTHDIPHLQFGMLTYGLGLEDEGAFVDNLIIELESIQD